MIQVQNSSSVRAYEYNETARIFSLQFVNSPRVIYDYPDFPPEAYAAFLDAPSKGSWVHRNIRGDAWRDGGFKGVKRFSMSSVDSAIAGATREPDR